MKEKRIAVIVLAAACVVTVVSMILGVCLRFAPGMVSGKPQNAASMPVGPDSELLFDNVDMLELDIAVADVTIKQGTENKVKIKADNEGQLPNVSYDDGRLVIKQEESEPDGKVHFIGIPAINKGFNIDLEITLGDALSSFKGNVDLGDVCIDGITTDAFEFEAACGDVDIKNCSFGGNALIEVHLGDIDIASCSFDNAVIESDMGDVDIEGSAYSDCRISLAMGELDVEGSEFSYLYAQIDTGSVTVDTAGEHAGYEIKAKADLGKVKVDGRDEGSSYNAAGDGASKKIELHNDLGAITIR